MSRYRRHKKEDYTHIDNHVFKDHSLSLKAKGLLTQIYSLPDDWEYSVKGLSTLFSDGRDAVNAALQELINHGYIVRSQKVNEFGMFDGFEYDIYEEPQTDIAENPFTENPFTENPLTDNPFTENPTQLNTNILITKELNTKELKKDIDISPKVDISIQKESKPKKRFIPPTLEEVREYCLERGNNVDPKQFFEYYQEGEWKDAKGNPVKNWKQKVITWEKNNYNRPNKTTDKPKTYNPFTELKRQEGWL